MKSFKNAKLALIPVMFLALGGSLLTVTFVQLRSQGKYSAALNLSGRQRTHNQRHMLEVMMHSVGNDSDYKGTRKSLVDSLKYLREGGRHEMGTIPAARNRKLISALDTHESKLRSVFSAADRYLDKTSQSQKNLLTLQSELAAKTDASHVAAHNVVLLLSKAGASSAAMNLSGRQRMLNQKHARVVLSTASSGSEREKIRGLLLESLGVLRDGGDHSFGKVEKATKPEILAALDLHQQRLDEVFETADRYLDYRKLQEAELREVREDLVASTHASHEAAQGVVSAIAAASKSSRTWGMCIAVAIGVALSAVGCVVSSRITKSTVADVSASATQIGVLASHELQQVSDEMQRSAVEVADKASSSTSAAKSLDSSAQTLVSSVSQFEENMQSISLNSSEVSNTVRSAVEKAENATSTIAELDEGATSIRDVVRTINEVAEQTNLLALNATIEAARAGTAGNGFAVVANEVKELANQTQIATQDIEKQIESNIVRAQAAIDAINDVSQTIFTVRERQDQIGGAVNEQSTVITHISETISNLAHGTTAIASDLSAIANAARATSDSSSKNQAAAAQINELADNLQKTVNGAKEDGTLSA